VSEPRDGGMPVLTWHRDTNGSAEEALIRILTSIEMAIDRRAISQRRALLAMPNGWLTSIVSGAQDER
jgi:hypothetical protein